MKTYEEVALINEIAETISNNIVNRIETSLQCDITLDQIETIETFIPNFFDTMIVTTFYTYEGYTLYIAYNVNTLEGVQIAIYENGDIEYYIDDCLTELTEKGILNIIEEGR